MPAAPVPKASSIEDLIQAKATSSAASAPSSVGGPPPKPAKKPNDDDVSTTTKLGETMKAISIREKEKLAQQRASAFGLEYIALRGFPIAPEALALLPRAKAEELKAVVFLFHWRVSRSI